jgi:hypothetical protein
MEVKMSYIETWILTEKQKPELGDNVEISDDGINVTETAFYKEDRVCMLAYSAPGAGRFSCAGFATDGSAGCETNLILDDPKYWRPIQ